MKIRVAPSAGPSGIKGRTSMGSILRLVSVTTLAAALAAVPGSAQKTTGPTERYEMDVATASGFAALAAGGKMGVGSAMSMMFGGGPDGKVAHTLDLRLGSNRGPTDRKSTRLNSSH